MGNGFGTECGEMRRYRLSWYGEFDYYRVLSNEKVQFWLVCGMGLV